MSLTMDTNMSRSALTRPFLGMVVQRLLVLLLITISCSRGSQASSVSSGCDAGWTAHGQSCYTALPHTERLYNFWKARNLCNTWRAELAELRSEENHQYLKSTFHGVDTWIGLTSILTPKRGPYWLYGERSLMGSPYQPYIETKFYQSWLGHTCFHMNASGTVVTDSCHTRHTTAICQRPRKVMPTCSPCKVKRGSDVERRLLNKALCQDFAVVGWVTGESLGHYHVALLAICSRNSAADRVLSRFQTRATLGSRCAGVVPGARASVINVQKPLPARAAQCPPPCGLRLKKGKRYLLAGSVHSFTSEFQINTGVALRWRRVKNLARSSRVNATCYQ
ncbi:uncharacterized protein LOC135820606 [Sycon ciliatum]|uniref:uncharacterized protein LOC135820606 n=2 Tax=Sycon ciliatum TaxID=27933 RepID=UPI0031F6DE44